MTKISVLRHLFIYIIILFFTVGSALSQSPFDLKRGESKPEVTNIKVNPNVNPFDLVRYKPISETNNPVFAKEIKEITSKQLPEISSGNKLITLILLLLLSTIILGNTTKLLTQSFKMFSNTNFLLQQVKVRKSLLPKNEQLLILILFIFNIIVLLLYSDELEMSRFIPIEYWSRMGIFFLLALILITLKFIINLILAFTFQQEKEFQIYLQTALISITILTLALIPLNLMLMYSTNVISAFIFKLSAFTIIISLVYFVLINTILSSKTITSRFFHFILYLCAFEIVPIALLVKYFTL